MCVVMPASYAEEATDTEPDILLGGDQQEIPGSGLSLDAELGLPQPTKLLADYLKDVVILMRHNQYHQAMETIDYILERYSGNRTARMSKGAILTKWHRYEEAFVLMSELLEEDGSDMALINNMAWMYATAEDYRYRDGEKALELGQQALLKNPQSYHVWSTVAEGHYITGNFRKAMDAAREALDMAVRYGGTTDNLRVYRGQVTKAYQALISFSLAD